MIALEKPVFSEENGFLVITMNKNILIIGGGIVGLATAYKLGRRDPGLHITVLEKENAVCQHQTGNNSGVLHTGLYYKPGSAKAKLSVSGIREMTAFCAEHQIAHEICGKLVVATDESELPRLRDLMERGTANGLQGLKWLTPAEMRAIEPNVAGVAGLCVPQTGIADYPGVGAKLVELIHAQGGRVVTRARVNRLIARDGWIAETPAGEFRAEFIINCAGLHCDRVSELAGEKRAARIVPFRGEYYRVKPARAHLVRHLIYPVPDPRFPFLGVHFTRMIRGGVEAGPNAVLAFAREGYRKTQIAPGDLLDTLAYPGFWKLMRPYWRMAIDEVRRSFSKKLFCESLQKLVPAIEMDDLEAGGAGIRAQAVLPSGEMIQDFYFVERANALHVLNAPSPAATAALAIGDVIAQKIM
jgi:L-2-hydroxyglutarate oxidase